jgi:hypothetical protein
MFRQNYGKAIKIENTFGEVGVRSWDVVQDQHILRRK